MDKMYMRIIANCELKLDAEECAPSNLTISDTQIYVSEDGVNWNLYDSKELNDDMNNLVRETLGLSE